MKSRWNLDEISRRFRWLTFSDLKIFMSPNSPKNDFFQNWPFHFWKGEKCTRGQKNANFAIFDVFSFSWQNQKKMFDDCDDFWRVGRGYGDTFTWLRRWMDFNEEARNMDLNGFSFLKQIKKKMFVDWNDFLGVYKGHYGTFTLLRGLSDFNEEARN